VLKVRAEAAQALLRACTMCELRCRVDRAAGERGSCGLAADSFVYKEYPSLNEEPELLPAWRVFLGGCNFGCPYCDEGPEAWQADAGRLVKPAAWARELAGVLDGGVKTISVLGGEPSLHIHTLLAAVAASSRPLPVALNTNLYMTPEVLELLDGVVRWYLVDFKFGNDACAERLAGVPRYTEVVRRNLLRIRHHEMVVIRHVLLPGHLECCFKPIADWTSRYLAGARFQLYPGYVPCGRAGQDGTLGRLNAPTEVQAATDYLRTRDLQCEVLFEQSRDRKGAETSRMCRHQRLQRDRSLTVAAPLKHGNEQAGLAGITVGADGRLYCHDLTPELASVLAELCPAEEVPTPGTRMIDDLQGQRR
jgi:putative pyruvate formate lyase activating enzyme